MIEVTNLQLILCRENKKNFWLWLLAKKILYTCSLFQKKILVEPEKKEPPTYYSNESPLTLFLIQIPDITNWFCWPRGVCYLEFYCFTSDIQGILSAKEPGLGSVSESVSWLSKVHACIWVTTILEQVLLWINTSWVTHHNALWYHL